MSSTSFGKTYQGTCLCKSIKVLLDGPPVKTLLCHCLDCQKSAGAPYQSCAIYPTSRVQVIDPDQSLKYYITPKEKVSSGSEKYIFFCGVCGTPLFNRPMSHEGEKTVIKTGFLDRIDKEPGLDVFRPQNELFIKDRVGYVTPVEGAHQYEEGF